MATVEIHILTEGTQETGYRRRFAKWVGDPGWLSMPAKGDNWTHCGGWAGETFRRVWWNGPGDPDSAAPHCVEITVSAEVFDHLIAEHGFAP